MKAIFLDIDGVMNNDELLRRGGIDTIDDSLLSILKSIVTATGAQIVLSSAWRLTERNRGLVAEALARHDMQFIDYTPDLWQLHRGKEIGDWLARHPEVEKYAILDDDTFAGLGHDDSYFRTYFETGLTVELAAKAIEHLGTNNERTDPVLSDGAVCVAERDGNVLG